MNDNQRKLAVGVLGLLALACVGFSTPQGAAAQQAMSSDSLSMVVANLRREVDAQSERIVQLEAKVARLLTILESTGLISEGVQRQENPRPPVAARGWMKSSTWGRIRNGMSERQVISILGSPTSREVDSTIDFVTLFYRGEVAGSGFVSGNVKLTDEDRVYTSNKPVF